MEVVRAFNNELSSLYEVKPPISKAKMTQITKCAIKGIKFYKHIVQSVEKFIQKCRPEYKVPGLYVIDSIVRQSRHQFGADKDVFGPRFVKNMQTTFQNLFKCGEDDRAKITRVLNLWQKNAVFPIEVIQPLLDMRDQNAAESHTGNDDSVRKPDLQWKGWQQGNEEPVQETRTYAEMSTKNLEKFNRAEMTNSIEDEMSRSSSFRHQPKVEKPTEEVKFNKKLLDFDYGDEEDEEESKNEDHALSSQPNALALSMAQNLLSNPELLRQLQQMQQTIQQSEVLNSELSMRNDDSSNVAQSSPQQPILPATSYQHPVMSHKLPLASSEADKDDRVIPEPPVQPQDLDERSLASVMATHDRLLSSVCLPGFQQAGVPPSVPLPQCEGDKDDRVLPDASVPTRDLDERSLASIMAPPERTVLAPVPFTDSAMQFQFDKSGIPFPPQPPPSLSLGEPLSVDAKFAQGIPLQSGPVDGDERMMYSMPGEPPLPPRDLDERTLVLPVEERPRKERSRSRSGSRSRGRSGRHRSRSRSPRRRRSTSRSRSRKNRSRSRERERIREKERERERERERKRKGLPPVKKGYVSVCSTTLWLGHVPKSCSEMDISDTFGPYGTILSIDMIPPRGCAYVVMDRRQDAYRALQKLKNIKLQGSSIKIAWAPGKGVKGKEYKDYWEVESGVSYVPYEKIPEDVEAMDLLEEGGFIDEESLPDNLKALRKQTDEGKGTFDSNAVANKISTETTTSYSGIQTPNMVPPPVLPPTSVGLPVVMPHLMQPQYGLPLSGLLPPQAMVIPMGIPPPNPMLMVQQQSQNILGAQAVPLVSGVTPIVPRTVPPVPPVLSHLKNSVQTDPNQSSPLVPGTTVSTAAGDATPTDEDGTSVSSPSVTQLSVPNTVSSSAVPVASTQQAMSQFNPVMNRPMLSVPPPVTSGGTPIPYPPPNVGFNFPPPGIRPPGQGQNVTSSQQFQWMQKAVGSTFSEAEPGNSVPRPLAPQSGMPLHMFGSRPPFPEHSSSVSSANQSVAKDSVNRDSGMLEMDISGNSKSPVHHDKMIQDMCISTDDESSMDRDYPRNDMPMNTRFQSPSEYPRGPVNVHRMRGPQVMQGPRFPRGFHMGSPFPVRMGGARGMGGPGPRPRMEMEFQHGPRGPRLPGAPPHRSHRGDHMHPHDERDWYPRDFDGPPFERDRDRRYDEWGREPWREHEEDDKRHMSRDHDDGRREDHRNRWNRDESRFSRGSRDGERGGYRNRNDFAQLPSKHPNENDTTDKSAASNNGKMNVDKPKQNSDPSRDHSSSDERKEKPVNKPKVSASLMDDMFKLRFYQRDKKLSFSASSNFNKQNSNKTEPSAENVQNNSHSEKKEKQDSDSTAKTDVPAENEKSVEMNNQGIVETENSSLSAKKERDRESRKRSRWGRTLSEEREFQLQKRNEIELKFQTYEQSHAAQQSVSEITESTSSDNSTKPISVETDNVNTEDPGHCPISLNSTGLSTDVPDIDIQTTADAGTLNISDVQNVSPDVVADQAVAENHSDVHIFSEIKDTNESADSDAQGSTNVGETVENIQTSGSPVTCSSPLVSAES